MSARPSAVEMGRGREVHEAAPSPRAGRPTTHQHANPEETTVSGPYISPEKFGLETIGEIEWSDESYSFDLTVLWKRTSDGRFVYADDSGCSCPSPFEIHGVGDLELLPQRGGLKAFQAHLAELNDDRDKYDARSRCFRDGRVVQLIELARKAGLR